MPRTTPVSLRAQASSASVIEPPENADDYRLVALMALALQQARAALEAGEAPIGCVIAVADGSVVGSGHNRMRQSRNLTSHAEIEAFADAAGRLEPGAAGVIMVSTLEPCVMCTGAAMESGVGVIAYGLQAPADSGTGRVRPPESPGASLPRVIGGIAAGESRALFEEWLARHAGDESRDEQRAFIQQLLALTTDTPGNEPA